jgi:NTE family protein
MLFFLLVSLVIIPVYTLNQLSFSGGGSFGAVEIGILKRLRELENKRYDIYTGISAGALNAAVLSYFDDVNQGIQIAEDLYATLRNRMVYECQPKTGLSILNTDPLCKTLTEIINGMPSEPKVHTLIGTTNLYSGNLDVYTFEQNNNVDKVRLMMASSAIPGLFPPMEYKGQLYADGGILSNELLETEYNGDYLNITYITPYEGFVYDDEPLTSLNQIMKRIIAIVLSNYNNPLTKINQNCQVPIGEINKYYVKPLHLNGYNILNFDKGQDLIDIGFQYMEHKKFRLC